MRRRGFIVASIASAGGASTAMAATWPTRPIRLIVAYPPGGISDGIARSLARHVANELEVAVLVENRGGAGGHVAMEYLTRAAPDGQTLCYSAVSPLLPSVGEAGAAGTSDLRALVAPVIAVTYVPILLVATPALAVTSFADLMAAARAAPGRLRWATSGIGTMGHLVLRQVAMAAGVDIVHVPYKGGGQQLTDALGGQFDLLSTNVASLQIEQVRSGRFKALAVGAPSRLPLLPMVPTFAEVGVPLANLASLFGVYAPAGTPATSLDRLNAAFDAALRQPDVGRDLAEAGNLPAGGSREAFAQQIERQLQQQRVAFADPASRR